MPRAAPIRLGWKPSNGKENEGISTAAAHQLIRELVLSRRSASLAEVEFILDQIASAPFDPTLRAARDLQGLSYLGRALRPREESLLLHLVKRVVDERQWAPGTTADDYLANLRRAVRHPDARLAVYERRGGFIAVTVTRTAHVIPVQRLGEQPLPHLMVVYSAERAFLLTGYQFSDPTKVSIPPEARWLK